MLTKHALDTMLRMNVSNESEPFFLDANAGLFCKATSLRIYYVLECLRVEFMYNDMPMVFYETPGPFRQGDKFELTPKDGSTLSVKVSIDLKEH